MQIAERTRQLAHSPTLSLDAKAKKMKADGRDVINYGIGEPDFETPENVKEAAVKAIRDGFTRYTPADGLPELKKAIIDKFKADNGLDYELNQVAASCGGKHALYNIFQTLFQAGDEVIIPAPFWVTYPPQIMLAQARPVIAPTAAEDGYCLRPGQLRAAITSRTRGLIINSPSNPTGGAYSRERLEALAEIVLKHDLWVISDDIYEKIMFDGFKFVNPAMLGPELKKRTVIAHGLSKTYAMTGWRLGFMAGPPEVVQGASKLQSQCTSNPCSITQKAGVAALTGPQDAVRLMVESFDRRRRMTVDLLNAIPGVKCPLPQGAFYVFPDVSAYFGKQVPNGRLIGGSADLADYLLESADLAAAPGAAFGEDRALRLSYALGDEDNKRGLARMARALAELK